MTVRALSNSERGKRFRERQAQGQCTFSFIADEVHIKLALVDLNLLRPEQYDDVVAVQLAVGKLVTSAVDLIMKTSPKEDLDPDELSSK